MQNELEKEVLYSIIYLSIFLTYMKQKVVIELNYKHIDDVFRYMNMYKLRANIKMSISHYSVMCNFHKFK